MLEIRSSPATRPNPHFREQARPRRQGNLAWLTRAAGKARPAKPGTALVLLGGDDPVSFRLRVAQSHMRHDLTPSRFSHVVLMEAGGGVADEGWEVSLEPAGGFGYPPRTNGVQRAILRRYDDAKSFPNVALLHVPVEWRLVSRALDQFMRQRAVLDTVELVTSWLPYVWGAGRAGNPLLEGKGLPSAAMVEVVLSAAGFELTPGVSSAGSTPEAIWQSARWWHEYPGAGDRAPLTGAWNMDHVLVSSPE
ncbi:hypothetical protein P2318_00665 [Myxococcaceae bacterium GXIMD 01537]